MSMMADALLTVQGPIAGALLGQAQDVTISREAGPVGARERSKPAQGALTGSHGSGATSLTIRHTTSGQPLTGRLDKGVTLTIDGAEYTTLATVLAASGIFSGVTIDAPGLSSSYSDGEAAAWAPRSFTWTDAVVSPIDTTVAAQMGLSVAYEIALPKVGEPAGFTAPTHKDLASFTRDGEPIRYPLQAFGSGSGMWRLTVGAPV